MSTSRPASGERPYRSHLQPACLPCRARKSRCKVELSSPSLCLMCKAHGSDCVFPDTLHEPDRAMRKALARRKHMAAAKSPPGTVDTPPPRATDPQAGVSAAAEDVREIPFPSPATVGSGGGDNSHVVGPVQSPDAQLIASYLQNDPGLHTRAGGIGVMPGSQLLADKRPILFNTIRSRPLGYTGGQSVASQKCEVIENLVGPFRGQLLDVYFDKVHRCFPLLDETSLRSQYDTKKSQISPALMSCLYAQSLIYWRVAKGPEMRHPNLRYVWNQATEALYSELHLSPGISTIIAILLNVSGRPLTTMIGNSVLLSSAIGLAHSLGLNRACLDWAISPSDKYLRLRLWWAIVVYDKWSSAAYGAPPQLRTGQHDVPIPNPDSILGLEAHHHDPVSTAVFVALVTLTGVLDRYLDHAFDLQPWTNANHHAVSLDIEARLTQWEDSLPQDLRRRIIRGVDLSIPGSANLRLAYLYLKLLGRKLGVDNEEQEEAAGAGIRTQRRILARQSAEDIVIFVQELDDTALGDFWLSFNAFALSSTVAFLLRSALETEYYLGGLTQSVSLKLASEMITALQSHRERKCWDLANICISQYAELVEKLAASDGRAAESTPALQQFLMAESMATDDLFPSIWDMLGDSS